MNNLTQLKIWKEAIDLTVNVYKVTADFPTEEKYGLISQSRRAAVSVSSNVAEGAGRNSDNEFAHFLGIANGSSYELQTQLIVAEKFRLLTKETLDPILDKIDKIQKMNYCLQNLLASKKISTR